MTRGTKKKKKKKNEDVVTEFDELKKVKYK